MSHQSAGVKRPVAHPLADSIVHHSFRLINWLDGFRRKRPWVAHCLVAILSALVAHAMWRYPLEGWVRRLGIDEHSDHYFYPVTEWLAHLVLVVIAFPTITFFLQLLLISQRGIAAHTLGLTWLSITGGDIDRLLHWFLRGHPETDPIRVICISGHKLFGCKDEGLNSPLRPWADRGKLDVVMPVSRTQNPTVLERQKRYQSTARARYPTVTKLVKEIDNGKAYLRAKENNVTEHDILCMWRVIVLQNYCLVQNYFPNLQGLESEHAPTFVYKNTGPDSYYQTYLEMFHLIKRYANTTPEQAAKKHRAAAD